MSQVGGSDPQNIQQQPIHTNPECDSNLIQQNQALPDDDQNGSKQVDQDGSQLIPKSIENIQKDQEEQQSKGNSNDAEQIEGQQTNTKIKEEQKQQCQEQIKNQHQGGLQKEEEQCVEAQNNQQQEKSIEDQQEQKKESQPNDEKSKQQDSPSVHQQEGQNQSKQKQQMADEQKEENEAEKPQDNLCKIMKQSEPDIEEESPKSNGKQNNEGQTENKHEQDKNEQSKQMNEEEPKQAQKQENGDQSDKEQPQKIENQQKDGVEDQQKVINEVKETQQNNNEPEDKGEKENQEQIEKEKQGQGQNDGEGSLQNQTKKEQVQNRENKGEEQAKSDHQQQEQNDKTGDQQNQIKHQIQKGQEPEQQIDKIGEEQPQHKHEVQRSNEAQQQIEEGNQKTKKEDEEPLNNKSQEQIQNERIEQIQEVQERQQSKSESPKNEENIIGQQKGNNEPIKAIRLTQENQRVESEVQKTQGAQFVEFQQYQCEKGDNQMQKQLSNQPQHREPEHVQKQQKPKTLYQGNQNREKSNPDQQLKIQSNHNIQKQQKQQELKEQQSQPINMKYQNIQNQALLSRIQELQQTVKQLKANQTSDLKKQPNDDDLKEAHEEEIHKEKSKKQQIHEKNVHNLVTELSKNDGTKTKPTLHQKRYRKRKLDLTNLLDKNMTHASNIFNVTIGQIIDKDKADQDEKLALKQEIKKLRNKVLRLEQEKKSHSVGPRGNQNSQRTESTSGKKPLCGKLVRISELKSSRVSQRSEMFFKSTGKSFRQNDFMGSSSEVREQGKEPVNFRVIRKKSSKGRKPSTQCLQFSIENDKYEENQKSQKQKTFVEQFQEQQKRQWWEEPFIKKLQIPDLPSPPSQFDTQEDLVSIGKLAFLTMDIHVSEDVALSIKKYKNCVYFSKGKQENILWYFDGRFYFGEWTIHLTGEGEKSGYGFEYVPGKYIYRGMFKGGKRNGYGIIRILNKKIKGDDENNHKEVFYEGNWEQNLKSGDGKQADQLGVKYQGNWKDGKKHGFGKLKLPDGDLYEGEFNRGTKSGHGVEVFKNGDKYDGNYTHNKFDGIGKYFWKNGSMYEGQFINGIREGHGKWLSNIHSEDYDQYEGEYHEDKKNGMGVYKWADGSEYEGMFKNDLKEGQGIIRYKNGKVAKLLWKNGQPVKKLYSEEEKKYREARKLSKNKDEGSKKYARQNSNSETIKSQMFSVLNEGQDL